MSGSLLTEEYYFDGACTYRKPKRVDYPSASAWLDAMHSWKDRITDDCNRAFTEQFRETCGRGGMR